MTIFAQHILIVQLLVLYSYVGSDSLYDNVMRRNEYDYIIVGAGAAGSVIAHRLSEDEGCTVLLLEAGGEPHIMTEVPLFADSLGGLGMDWGYVIEPQVNACLGFKGQVNGYGESKVLGGSTSTNPMIYNRGNRRDYDDWEKGGASGWAWDNVRHYFLKSEDQRDPFYADSPEHAVDGLWTVSTNDFFTPLRDSYIDAITTTLGVPEMDVSAEAQPGVSKALVFVRDGLRCGTEKAFLQSAVDRPNLDILTWAHVTRVQFDEEKRARAVFFDQHNRSRSVSAKKEIILSAGALRSPQILMLSGVGPKEHLQQFGIPVISDLPAVGRNLQDSVTTSAQMFSLNSTVGLVYPRDVDKMEIGDFVGGKGPLAMAVYHEGIGYARTKYQNESGNRPDIQFVLISTIYGDLASRRDQERIAMEKSVGKDAITIFPILSSPKSRGFVKLRSRNPHDLPIIDPRFLTDEDDLKRLVEGMKMTENMMAAPALKRFGPVRIPEVILGCEGIDKASDAYMACLARDLTTTSSQACGTCRMGDPWDTSTVLDPELRVKGVKGLRVADASVMPNMMSGNPTAACVMIGEKASDMIRGRRYDPKTARVVIE